MSIEEIIQAWKSDEEIRDSHVPANCVGKELTDQELRETMGGMMCTSMSTCDISCHNGVSCDSISTYAELV
jgi:hypothetical protein